MINFETIANLANDDGLTLKGGAVIRYKSGYQVATEGVETESATEAFELVKRWKDCGVWYSGGVYYIDKCHRVSTKREAVKLGKLCNQQSIYDWKREALIWL